MLVNLKMAASLLMTADDRVARLLVAEKEVFRNVEAEATAAHFDRLRARQVDLSNQHDASRRHAGFEECEYPHCRSRCLPGVGEQGRMLPSRLRQDIDTGG